MRRRALPPAALPPGPDVRLTARDLLLHSWPGRLFLIAAALKLLVTPFRLAGDPPAVVQMLGIAATAGLIISISWFVWRLFVLTKRRLLWRVRRKLIISYIFIGLVPAALLFVFFLVGASTLTGNVGAYLFRDGYDDIVGEVRLYNEAAANEVGRAPEALAETMQRVHRNGARRYPDLVMAFVPLDGVPLEGVAVGRWDHVAALPRAPSWLTGPAFEGNVVLSEDDGTGSAQLAVRLAHRVVSGQRTLGYVISDLPIDVDMVQRLYNETGVRSGGISINPRDDPRRAVPVIGGGSLSLFRHSVAFLDVIDWESGRAQRGAVSLTFRLRDLYTRLSLAQNVVLSNSITVTQLVLGLLVVIAVLFLGIQLIALAMGLALARSITSSIHELFTGTERVRHGDFSHRIKVETRDQLGELADSFNQMTGSIEGLLLTAADKKRLEEELRIARQIQMSLLPRGPLNFPGLAVTALCVPAREVGGDYYDFFPLSHDRLGVLIADVSGKGTSAALYMAELKGLVLALSQTHASPRELLIEVNRIISEHLDSRSFITMTYAVIDLQRGIMRYCRAGHTPLIFLPALTAAGEGVRVLTPNGMVLGLRIDGAEEKFMELLEEEEIDLGAGDVIVLYTDGISEAMNHEQDLFGEARLGRLVAEHGHLESGELRERILRELEAFVGGADQHDDMTMILIKVERAFAAARVAV